MSENSNMHETQPEKYVIQDSREPFHDVIDHFNTVNGYQRINKPEQLPKKFRKPIKIYNLLVLIAILATVIGSLVHSLFH